MINAIDKNQFIKMGDLLQHRGPDNTSNFFINEKIGLNVSRLRIHDKTSSSDQPFKSDCGRYIILFNGAIFNFKKLKKELESLGESFSTISDTEVLLALIDSIGVEKTIKKIEGMFAFALWDNKKDLITLFRDRFGEKPLYWGNISNGELEGFMFSSDISSFVNLSDKLNISDLAKRQYYEYGCVLSPNTIFDNIYQLQPGYKLTIPNVFFDSIHKNINSSEPWDSITKIIKKEKIELKD